MSTRAEKMKSRRESIADSKGGFDFFIFKPGVVRMRAVQVGEDDEIGIELMHFFLGKEIGSFVSPATFGLPCAFMEKVEKLKASNSQDDKDLASKIKPKKKYAVLFYKYLDDKGLQVDEQNGVKPALLSGGQYQDLCDLYLEEETGDFTDPLKGYDIKFKRVGSGQFDTEYSLIHCKSTRSSKLYRGIYDLEAEIKKLLPTYEQTQEYVRKFFNLKDPAAQKSSSSKPKVKINPKTGKPFKKKTDI